jgi:hypothetical protein
MLWLVTLWQAAVTVNEPRTVARRVWYGDTYVCVAILRPRSANLGGTRAVIDTCGRLPLLVVTTMLHMFPCSLIYCVLLAWQKTCGSIFPPKDFILLFLQRNRAWIQVEYVDLTINVCVCV